MQKYLKLINNISNLKIRYANIEDLHFTLKLHNLNVLKEKSVSSLFNKNPPLVINLEPNPFSIVVVIDKAFPYTSTIEIC